ncbi:unnamed protein product [Gongylonema pulchrum]|uniref:ARID domain-containing protein n=1 Tax=Gongylonema pulchrum TaxID=637853 RepID=A0A183E2Z9_9BILA|nr:unnamed protein product [Gongylonema pulchrum]
MASPIWYGAYCTPGLQQTPSPFVQATAFVQPGLLVQCPNCAARFHVPAGAASFAPPFTHSQFLRGATPYARSSAVSMFQQQPQYHPEQFFPQTAAQSFVRPPSPYNPERPQHLNLALAAHSSGWRYAPQSVSGQNTVGRVRELIIDILTSPECEFGITSSRLLALLKHACVTHGVSNLPPTVEAFENFLDYHMADYVEGGDGIYRYRRPRISIQETGTANSPVTGPSRIGTPLGVSPSNDASHKCTNVAPVVTERENVKTPPQTEKSHVEENVLAAEGVPEQQEMVVRRGEEECKMSDARAAGDTTASSGNDVSIFSAV